MVRVNDDIPPPILAFAHLMRDTFGSNVKLYRGRQWPGGADGGRRGR